MKMSEEKKAGLKKFQRSGRNPEFYLVENCGPEELERVFRVAHLLKMLESELAGVERAARIGDGEEWLVNRLLVPVRRNVCQALAMKRYKPGSKKTEKAFPFDELKAGALEELINEMPF